jgi:phospholipid/cholesterol/gamma-HCH transport system permease protein
MLDFLSTIGRITLLSLAALGRLAFFTGETLSHVVRPPFYGAMLLRQMMSVGYNSLVVVGLTAVFTGMVLALQSYTGFSRSFESENAIALIVLVAVTRELGPVIAGLMVAGRVGAAIAAEIGTMRVTDQIDALTTLSTNPMKYLVVPRVIAGLITMPLLVLVADIIGVAGGYLVSTYKLGFNPNAYLSATLTYLQTDDVVSGLIKAGVFGFIITLMGCYHGYNSRGGAQGVGAATTAAVVSASITILLTDYIMTSILFTSK